MDSIIPKTKKTVLLAGVLLIPVFLLSLLIGRFPLSLAGIFSGNELQRKVFISLRLSRSLIALIGGFAIGITGFVFQSVFRNPLASPDIIGVSSGASAGAAFGILLFDGYFSIIVSSFTGALISLLLVLLVTYADRSRNATTFVISGIIIHSLSQAVLMALKTTADPEKELASIEYWIMGSLNGITLDKILPNLFVCVISVVILFVLYRQIILLSLNDDEAKMLGVKVSRIRFLILLIATLTVASVISLTGLISFIGLIPAHIARTVNKNNSKSTMILSGLAGSIILIISDILARSLASSELPISIFTCIIGTPVLLYYLIKGRSSK